MGVKVEKHIVDTKFKQKKWLKPQIVFKIGGRGKEE